MAMTRGSAAVKELETVTEARECDKHGPYQATQVRGGTLSMPWSMCPGCMRQRDDDELAKERAKHIERRLAAANLPARYARATLASYNATEPAQVRAVEIVRDYLDRFDDHLAAGRCLLFYGSTGTGKTHLATALVRALVERGRMAHYTTLADLLNRIRATWRRAGDETEADVLAYLRRLDLLVLDEVGVQFGTDAERVQITNVVDARYRDMKPTVVITNCGRDELRDYLGDRALSRLRENGGKGVVFDWADYRGSKQ